MQLNLFTVLVIFVTAFFCEGSLRGSDLSFERFVESNYGLELATERTRILTNSNFTCISPGSAAGEVTETCSYHGVCQSDGQCYCDLKYATYPEDSVTQCNYHRKSRFIAFVWHLFFGLEADAGEWYLGNKDYATFEVVLFLPALIGFTCVFAIFGCCIDACNPKKEKKSSNEKGEATMCCGFLGILLGVLSMLAMFGWWGFELWSLSTFHRTDVNGIDMW
jgi:hypothetical protein